MYKTPFDTAYTALTGDGAQWVADAGIKFVGIDYLSIATYEELTTAHQNLMRAVSHNMHDPSHECCMQYTWLLRGAATNLPALRVVTSSNLKGQLSPQQMLCHPHLPWSLSISCEHVCGSGDAMAMCCDKPHCCRPMVFLAGLRPLRARLLAGCDRSLC